MLEKACGKITRDIKQGLKVGHMAEEVTITQGENFTDFSGNYDLLVVSPVDLVGSGKVGEKTRAKMLLLADNFPENIFEHISAQLVVSYGLSVKDSITLSSILPQQAVLTLQRELLCLNGTSLEQQEIPLKIPFRADAGRIMAVNGALLLLGVLPGDLPLVYEREALAF